MFALPSWVCIILTSRPEVRDMLSKWLPEEIRPEDEENKADLRLVLSEKLKHLRVRMRM
jgi:hypothetical protein